MVSGRELNTKFIRVWENAVKKPGFKYKRRSDPYGDKGFLTRTEAEKLFSKLK